MLPNLQGKSTLVDAYSLDPAPGTLQPVDFGDYSTGIDWLQAERFECPKCRGEYCHLTRVVVNRGGDITLVNGSEPARAILGLPTGRGSSVWIEFACEEGCRWRLRWQFHKGASFGLVEILPSAGESGDDFACTFWRD